MSASPYLEHLGESDLELLVRLSDPGGRSNADDVLLLKERPEALEAALSHPRVFERLFGRHGQEPLLFGSAFLTFAVLLHHCAASLESASFTLEWTGPRQRLPVFGVAGLKEFLESRDHRLFLAELLASYTHVASGALWVRSRRGWRRQRFSELDPIRLASLLDVVPEEDKPGVYRRLGDLALFLTGVFPDHSSMSLGVGLRAERFARLARVAGADPDLEGRRGDPGALELLEQLGQRWYRLALDATKTETQALRMLASVAERFQDARRVLNIVADRYLFPLRSRWFPGLT